MVFKRILVPLDGSTLSEMALEPALALAQLMKGEVVLLTALASAQDLTNLEPFSQEAPPLATDPLPMRERLLDYLNSVCASRAGAGVPMRALVREGNAVDAIVETAVSLATDIIIMGAHGRSGISRLLLGSITQQVARHAHCPVLAVHNRHAMHNILVVVNRILLAEHALDPSFALAGCFNAQVHLLLTAQIGTDQGEPGSASADNAPDSQEWADTFRYEEAYLEDLVDRYRMDKPIKTAVRAGKPEAAILSYAQTHQIDLIVIAERPYSRWRRLLFGSLTEKILRESNCSVMVVRPNTNDSWTP